MRLAIEDYVDRGGHFARFAANFTWQIRLEQEGGAKSATRVTRTERT